MLINDARYAVLQEWLAWRAREIPKDRQPRGTDGLSFFMYLRRTRPDLLTFRANGDRWQYVHGWLLSANVVCD